MILRVRKPFWIMLSSAILLAGSIIAMEYSGMCKLNDMAFANNNVENSLIDSGKYKGFNLFDIPLEDIADMVLKDKKIVKVDVDYSLPGKLKIKCNDLEPIALVMPEQGGKLYQLDRRYCLLPFSMEDMNLPIITGAQKCSPYKMTGNKALIVLADELQLIKNDFMDFYLAISNIELKSGDRIVIYLDGLPFGIKTYAGMLCQTIKRLKLFLLEYNPDLDGIKHLDMRLKNTIIATG